MEYRCMEFPVGTDVVCGPLVLRLSQGRNRLTVCVAQRRLPEWRECLLSLGFRSVPMDCQFRSLWVALHYNADTTEGSLHTDMLVEALWTIVHGRGSTGLWLPRD